MSRKQIDLTDLPESERQSAIEGMFEVGEKSAFRDLSNQQLEQDVKDILISMYPELAKLPDVDMNRKLSVMAGSNIKDAVNVFVTTVKLVVDYLGKTTAAGIGGGAIGGTIASRIGASPEAVMAAIVAGGLTGVISSLIAEVAFVSKNNISPRQTEDEQTYTREYLAVRDYRQNLSEIKADNQMRRELSSKEVG